jgi:hypothetical protein
VQEHGGDAPPPNTRKVYIAYLDSVRYLRPNSMRTPAYHELLAAYLASARRRGFGSAHIWACPPQRGDGYIFHVHPPSQRVPSKERLREWYDDMLRGLTEEGVAVGVPSALGLGVGDGVGAAGGGGAAPGETVALALGAKHVRMRTALLPVSAIYVRPFGAGLADHGALSVAVAGAGPSTAGCEAPVPASVSVAPVDASTARTRCAKPPSATTKAPAASTPPK